MRRHLLPLAFFAISAVAALAACGGGGGSALVPHAGSGAGSGSGSGPSSTKTTRATMVMYVPPASHQSGSRRPFYISSNTQSFGVLVVPVGSTQTPTPLNLTIFPVATPSPCAAASGGGESCTLTVTAPVGNDIFYVAAFATASPNANAVPLSEFISGAITVSLSPSPGATPLSFTLNSVVNSAAVAVASPDPGNTPNTQVFAIAAPSAAPLGISAYDSTGAAILNDPTTPFAQPLVVKVSPAPDGVTLALTSASQCGSAASGAAATIDCAADLGNLKVVYDGTTHPDSTDHAIDAFTIDAQAQVSPGPSPANLVLASNVIADQINVGGSYAYDGWLQRLPSGDLLYALPLYNDSNIIGTYTPSTRTFGTSGTLNGISTLTAVAVAPNGSIWVVDDNSAIDCWSSTSSATAGAAPAVSGIAPLNGPDTIELYTLAVDKSNNVWYQGYDTSTSQSYVGYFPAASGCTSPGTFTNIALAGDSDDDSTAFTALSAASGVAFASIYQGLYAATTSSGSSVSAEPPALGGGMGAGVAADASGTVYATFYTYNPSADLESGTVGGALSTLLTLLPNPGSYPYSTPMYLSSFSPTNGAADRLLYADTGFEALGVVGNLHTTPTTELVGLPNTSSILATTHGTSGQQYALYVDSTPNMYIARVINTHTWSVPVSSYYGGCNGAVVSIDERGDSGPFTVNAPGASFANALPGTDHDYVMGSYSSSPFTITVTDPNGRTETLTVTASASGC